MYPQLSGKEARRLMKEDRAAEAVFEQRERSRIASSLNVPRAKKATAQERRRVAAIITRDNQEYAKEIARQAATLEVRDGLTVNIVDTVMEPTPEWLKKFEHKTFVPKIEGQTVRTLRGVRRVVKPAVARLYDNGHLDEGQLAACLWYRWVFEASGLQGKYCASRFDSGSPADKTTRTGGFAGHIPITLSEAEARRAYRSATETITASYQRFFDAVVLDDVPIYRSWRLARCSRPKAFVRLRRLADDLASHCEAEGVDLQLIDRN